MKEKAKISFESVLSMEKSDNRSEKPSYDLYLKEVKEAIMKMDPVNFGNTLVNLMEWRKISKNDMADALYISSKTIQRMRASVQCCTEKKTLIAICVVMQLPPHACKYFLQIAGYQFSCTSEDIKYDLLLNSYFINGRYDCNILLTKLGYSLI